MNFKRQLLRAAKRQLRRNKITRAQYSQILEKMDNDEFVSQFEAEVSEQYPKTGIQNLFQWFIDNWTTILRIFLTLLPLFLMEKADDN
jgi:hypothetical protein